MDVPKQIDYWRTGGQEDMEVAEILCENGRFRHALFLAHLAIEKALKAHVTQQTREVPPKIHNLLRLAELAGLTLPVDRVEFLNTFDAYQLEGRYPDMVPARLDQKKAAWNLMKARENFKWLIAQLPI